LSYSLPVGAAVAFLMLAVGISYRQKVRAAYETVEAALADLDAIEQAHKDEVIG
jgi:hypothetical protein